MYDFRQQLAKITGLTVGNFSRVLKLGSGQVIPGHVSLSIDADILRKTRPLLRNGCIFITGTNGKSTTTYYITTILRSLGFTVATNYTGANMRAGIAAACLSIHRPVDYGIFEVDEASVSRLANELQPSHLICLNFSRDQLDRYSEIEMLIHKIAAAARANAIRVIYNYGNPYSAALGQQIPDRLRQSYVVTHNNQPPALDLPICRACSAGLITYKNTRIGCTGCELTQGAANLVGAYNDGMLKILEKAIGAPNAELAETLTACISLLTDLGIEQEQALVALERTPPLPVHRVVAGDIELILGKNPESFQRLLREVIIKKPAQVVLAINDSYADGLDTSWLWDVDFQSLRWANVPVYTTGRAAADIALRLKVAGITTLPLKLRDIPVKESMLILANYTAYREIETILGKKTRQTSAKPLDQLATEYDYI